jgi:hypothetical protein
MRPLNAIPEANLVDRNENLLKKWQKVNQISQLFWKRWHMEFLNDLQMRYKWFNKVNVQVGQMVLLKDDNLPPQSWICGRIVSISPGPDNVTRVVDLKTSKGLLLSRPVNRLCFLPLHNDSAPGRNVQN